MVQTSALLSKTPVVSGFPIEEVYRIVRKFPWEDRKEHQSKPMKFYSRVAQGRSSTHF